LPLAETPRSHELTLAALREKHGVDPADVEAMIDLAFPKNHQGYA